MNTTKIPFRKRVALDLFNLKKKIDSQVHDLTYLFWECTLRCNLTCLHCGSDCTKNSSTPDMPIQDFLRVLDSIKEKHNPNKIIIAITGGEPLMRTDLEQCGHEIYNRGFPWGIVTNGYAMTRERFEKLLDAGLRSMTISLDGLKETHDWFRNRQGSFERALAAIGLAAMTDNLVYDIATCVSSKSFNELEKIRDLLIEKGVKQWRLFTVFPKGRASENEDLKITDTQFCKLMDFIAETKKQGIINPNYGCEGFLGAYEGLSRDNLFRCSAGINIGSVLIDGSISACPSLRADYIQGNIYKDDFLDVWNNRYQIMRDRSWTKTGECASCNVYKWCGGNGLHLRQEKTGKLLTCHYKRIINS